MIPTIPIYTLFLKKQFYESIPIDDFGVTVALLRGGANSSQIFINVMIHPAMLEPLLSENCKDLTMKLEIKYLFPTSSSGVKFSIYQLFEGMEMRKILAHFIRMQKKPQTREHIFWIFTDFHRVAVFPLISTPGAF